MDNLQKQHCANHDFFFTNTEFISDKYSKSAFTNSVGNCNVNGVMFTDGSFHVVHDASYLPGQLSEMLKGKMVKNDPLYEDAYDVDNVPLLEHQANATSKTASPALVFVVCKKNRNPYKIAKQTQTSLRAFELIYPESRSETI